MSRTVDTKLTQAEAQMVWRMAMEGVQKYAELPPGKSTAELGNNMLKAAHRGIEKINAQLQAVRGK